MRKLKKLKKPKKLKKHYKKRGRPKKAYTETQETSVVSNVKTFKFLGYCLKCNFMLYTGDKVSKIMVVCPSCGKKLRVSVLRKVRKIESEKPKNKKEYLESTIHVNYEELPPLNDEVINPNDLRIQE